MQSEIDFGHALLAHYHDAGEGFGHRQHLHASWSFLRAYGAADGAEATVRFLRRVAAHEGAPEKYNETLTRFWIDAVRLADAAAGTPPTFEDVIAAEPHLLDRHLALGHWSPERLWSNEARLGRVEPDLRAVEA